MVTVFTILTPPNFLKIKGDDLAFKWKYSTFRGFTATTNSTTITTTTTTATTYTHTPKSTKGN
ncbi:hypothetical protein E2C01_047350 [Portunus trituberculatus]|uniref:Uncharacterized protein n=1 Tax=Portunus trituberculatus TaxID=210409 RepID=A0A5B7G778_PORTR|nr:hypothetical protein [Portunus trituberculatus]